MIHKINIEKTPVYFQESQSLPMLDIQINFRAGSAFDDKLNGLADLAVSMFATKTQSSSEEVLINKITDIGISIHAETTKEFFNIKIRLLNDRTIIDKTINILHEIFTTPDFDPNILDREKIQTLTHINYLNQQSNYLASLEFSKNIFLSNPYSHPVIGYESSVKDINIEDIKSFFNKYICANNANICIVGAVDLTQAENISHQIINSLPKGDKNTLTFCQQTNDTKIIKKSFNSKQTSILMGHQLLLSIEDPLYFPLKLGNEILGGGGLNSLLFNKVREELGLVYNISSNANLNPDYGSFVISAQTSNPTLALETINDVYNEFIKNIVDNKTLENSKKHIEGTHLLSSVKNSSKLNMLSSIANKDLPLDFFDTYVRNINNVTAKQIHDSFSQVQQNKFITVMVGDV
ncbi:MULTISPECIES: M16 family metallopeptidase [unclassified Francisella]|uniref:M16 family metallopeptidase n=1 Tax=unclassified Francisella TaxID=2610885 RepID=UPI002E32E659|nr:MULTISPECIES: pitrilysin family protein [unclassified Francisella]MED7818659.1 pitrilysin family protein [Francisella sp. 19S2-4]MED7829495.1 pitrilysin family protein [Francisella sp. 19S2-10]